jgi:hypothetical protein
LQVPSLEGSYVNVLCLQSSQIKNLSEDDLTSDFFCGSLLLLLPLVLEG